MIGRKTVTGLLLLCALVFCAVGASSASAKGMTAYECVSGGSGGLGIKWSDADCETTNFFSGSFGHKEITTEINIDSKLVSANYKLNTTLLTLATEITCTGQTTEGKIKNVAGPPMKAEGTAYITFSGCVVNKPLKCVVHTPGQFSKTITVDAVIKSVIRKEAPEEEHGLEYSGNGGPLTSLVFGNNGLEKCALNEKTFWVEGTIIGTGAFANMTGGIQHFKKTQFWVQNLTVGGEPATLEGETTITNAATNNALTLTTTET